MTIKQQGGIFGRNPTFNDVVVNDISASKVTTSEIAHSDLAITGVGEVKINGTIAGAGSSKLQVTQDSGVADWTGIFQADTTTGLSYGLAVRAGTNSSDYGFLVRNAANTQTLVAVTGDGNLVIGTAGSGIDFSATAGTGTSELFDDYEEGNWSPQDSVGGALTVNRATYVKVGQLVFLTFDFVYTATASSLVTNLPFTATAGGYASGFVSFSTSGIPQGITINAGTATFDFSNLESSFPSVANARLMGTAIYTA